MVSALCTEQCVTLWNFVTAGRACNTLHCASRTREGEFPQIPLSSSGNEGPASLSSSGGLASARLLLPNRAWAILKFASLGLGSRLSTSMQCLLPPWAIHKYSKVCTSMQFQKYVTHPNCSSSFPLFGVGPMLQLDVAIFILNISIQQLHGKKITFEFLREWLQAWDLWTSLPPSTPSQFKSQFCSHVISMPSLVFKEGLEWQKTHQKASWMLWIGLSVGKREAWVMWTSLVGSFNGHLIVIVTIVAFWQG